MIWFYNISFQVLCSLSPKKTFKVLRLAVFFPTLRHKAIKARDQRTTTYNNHTVLGSACSACIFGLLCDLYKYRKRKWQSRHGNGTPFNFHALRPWLFLSLSASPTNNLISVFFGYSYIRRIKINKIVSSRDPNTILLFAFWRLHLQTNFGRIWTTWRMSN